MGKKGGSGAGMSAVHGVKRAFKAKAGALKSNGGIIHRYEYVYGKRTERYP